MAKDNKETKPHVFTEDDLDSCWPAYKTYLLEILNKKSSVEESIEDLNSLIGSEFDPRVDVKTKPNKQ